MQCYLKELTSHPLPSGPGALSFPLQLSPPHCLHTSTQCELRQAAVPATGWEHYYTWIILTLLNPSLFVLCVALLSPLAAAAKDVMPYMPLLVTVPSFYRLNCLGHSLPPITYFSSVHGGWTQYHSEADQQCSHWRAMFLCEAGSLTEASLSCCFMYDIVSLPTWQMLFLVSMTASELYEPYIAAWLNDILRNCNSIWFDEQLFRPEGVLGALKIWG